MMERKIIVRNDQTSKITCCNWPVFPMKYTQEELDKAFKPSTTHVTNTTNTTATTATVVIPPTSAPTQIEGQPAK
jgi:hypothetical protein